MNNFSISSKEQGHHHFVRSRFSCKYQIWSICKIIFHQFQIEFWLILHMMGSCNFQSSIKNQDGKILEWYQIWYDYNSWSYGSIWYLCYYLFEYKICFSRNNFHMKKVIFLIFSWKSHISFRQIIWRENLWLKFIFLIFMFIRWRH